MITLKINISLEEEDAKFVKQLQAFQSSMIRSSYQLASRGYSEKDIRAILKDRSIDSWFTQSAIKNGIGMRKADDSLGVKTRIFGGKGNLTRRAKGRLSKEEWKKSRLLPIYSIGESPQKGNRKFNFHKDHIIFKPFRGKKIRIDLPRLKKNFRRQYDQIISKSRNGELPITVSLTENSIYMSFEYQDDKIFPNPISGRYAGIDMNPNHIGVSVFQNGLVVDKKIYNLKDLTGKNTNNDKLNHETIEIGHSIGKWLKHLRVEHLFIEDLSFKQGDSRLGKGFNRLTKNQWKRGVFESTLEKYFPKMFRVNAAYSSTIGNILHRSYPDPIAASMEIARRGYDLIILKNKKFYPDLPSNEYLEDLWKETEIFEGRTWKDLHSWAKEAKLSYRVPIPPRDEFRLFSSRRSKVGVL